MNEIHLKTEPISSQITASPCTDAPVSTGELLLGRYRVHDWRAGGFAYVAGVQDEHSREWYAVKVPKVSDRNVAEFESEMSFWIRMAPHLNIVRAFSVVEIAERPALLLEFVGGPLNTVRSLLKGGVPLNRNRALEFTRQIALGMESAGKMGEVAHLDLKPENLMVTADGTLKITDFGLARRVIVVDDRYPMISNGTWPYMAPECFAGKPVDCRADIYACGVILYEMLNGKTPFDLDFNTDLYKQMRAFHESGKLRKLTADLFWHGHPGVDERPIRELVSNCLEWFPGERPRSFRYLGEELDRIMNTPTLIGQSQTVTSAEEFHRAISLCKLGKLDDALSLFNRVMVMEPHNTALWSRIAEILETLGETTTAEQIRRRL